MAANAAATGALRCLPTAPQRRAAPSGARRGRTADCPTSRIPGTTDRARDPLRQTPADRRKVNISQVSPANRWASARSPTGSGSSALWNLTWVTLDETSARTDPESVCPRGYPCLRIVLPMSPLDLFSKDCRLVRSWGFEPSRLSNRFVSLSCIGASNPKSAGCVRTELQLAGRRVRAALVSQRG